MQQTQSRRLLLARKRYMLRMKCPMLLLTMLLALTVGVACSNDRPPTSPPPRGARASAGGLSLFDRKVILYTLTLDGSRRFVMIDLRDAGLEAWGSTLSAWDGDGTVGCRVSSTGKDGTPNYTELAIEFRERPSEELRVGDHRVALGEGEMALYTLQAERKVLYRGKVKLDSGWHHDVSGRGIEEERPDAEQQVARALARLEIPKKD